MMPLTSTPAFGILLTIVGYALGLWIKEKTKSVFANPILIALVFIAGFLIATGIPYEAYQVGGNAIHYFLGPLTVTLGLMLYRQRQLIQKHFISLIIGIISGVVASFITILVLGKLLGVDMEMITSLMPKSITTPMALSLVEIIGGNPAITVVMVIITGIFGALIAPLLVVWFPKLHKVAVGVGIGTAAHAVGTSKALELGETEGALSSAAIGLAGLITVLLVPLLLSVLSLFN